MLSYALHNLVSTLLRDSIDGLYPLLKMVTTRMRVIFCRRACVLWPISFCKPVGLARLARLRMRTLGRLVGL